MSNVLGDKLIQSKQRLALKGLLEGVGDKVHISSLISHPAAGDVVNSMIGRLVGDSSTTRMLSELHGFVARFIQATRKSAVYRCVLPGVSLSDGHAITRFPVVETDANGAKELFAYFADAGDLDFFGLSVQQGEREEFLVISSHADFPTEDNGFFDGAVYSIWTNVLKP